MSQDYGLEESEQPQRPRTIFNALLFPANLTGLAHIGIYTVCFLLLAWVESAMLGYTRIAAGFIGLIVSIEFIGYMYHCIRESASGAMAAPDSMFADSFDFSDITFTFGGYFQLEGQYLGMILPSLICFLPATLYPIFTERFDHVFVILLAAGIFYFPMLLMAVVLFDSSSGYNPFIHIISMIKTFLSYCILVLEVAFVVAGCIGVMFLFRNAILAAIFLFPIQMYLVMVLMHLLGRFYYLHQHKLNWDV